MENGKSCAKIASEHAISVFLLLAHYSEIHQGKLIVVLNSLCRSIKFKNERASEVGKCVVKIWLHLIMSSNWSHLLKAPENILNPQS